LYRGFLGDPHSIVGSLRVNDQPGTTRFVDTSAFIGTNPTDEPITSGLPVIRQESDGEYPAALAVVSDNAGVTELWFPNRAIRRLSVLVDL
jgi:hypothetical protein